MHWFLFGDHIENMYQYFEEKQSENSLQKFNKPLSNRSDVLPLLPYSASESPISYNTDAFTDISFIQQNRQRPQGTVNNIPKSIIEKSISHCPNCIKGICKIRKHHKMIHDGSVYKPLKKHLQSVPYWEKSGMFWSGAATPTPARVPDFKLRLNPSNETYFK